MGKYVRILCGVMAVLVAATALGLWQLAEAPQYVAAAESRGQAKPVSFGTDTALVPVHLESQTQEEQLVLRVLAADTEEPVRGALFVVELIDGDGQKTVCKDWDLDGVITTEAMPEGDYTAHLRTLAGFLMPEDTVVTVEPMKREVIDVSDQVVSSDEVDSRTEDGQYGDKKPDDAGSGSSEELPPSIDTPDPEPEPTPEPEETPEPEKGVGGLNPAVLLAVLVLLGGGGALAYFKLVKGKQASTRGSADLDDYDYGEDEGDADVELDKPETEDEEL